MDPTAQRRQIHGQIETILLRAAGARRPLNATEQAEVAALQRQDDELRAQLSGGSRRSPAESGTRATTLQELDRRETTGFRSLGEQLQAIALAGRTDGAQQDPRLIWRTLAPSGASAGVPSDGGYLIQKDFQVELVNKMYEIGNVLSRVRKIPISEGSDGIKIPMINETSRANGSRWGGVQVYWGAEADAATAKKPKLRQMELELKDLIGLAYMTNRLMSDAAALEAIFTQAFTEEMSFKTEEALFSGTGAGQPLGVLNSGAVVSVAKETGQAANTLLYENVVKMYSRMWSRSRQSAAWYINQDVEPQLLQMAQTIGTGGVPVYLPPNGASASPFGTLFGIPVIPVEYCSTLGTTGDVMLIDFSQYVLIDKGQMQSDSSIHVRFVNNENTFRFIYRVDGQPSWNSTLTAANGSTTYSPYVKLDTRA